MSNCIKHPEGRGGAGRGGREGGSEGSLLSTHLLIRDEGEPFGRLTPTDYDNELLRLAHDLSIMAFVQH